MIQDIADLDFDMEILSCLMHLKIFKHCRSGYLDCKDFPLNLKLYEVLVRKDLHHKSLYHGFNVEMLLGADGAFFEDRSSAQLIQGQEDLLEPFSCYTDDELVFIGLDNGLPVFFDAVNAIVAKFTIDAAERFIKENVIKVNQTAFGLIYKNKMLAELAEVNENDLSYLKIS